MLGGHGYQGLTSGSLKLGSSSDNAELLLEYLELFWDLDEESENQKNRKEFWSTIGLITNIIQAGFNILYPDSPLNEIPGAAAIQLERVMGLLDNMNGRLDRIISALNQLPAEIAAAIRKDTMKQYFEDTAGMIEGAQIRFQQGDYEFMLTESINGLKKVRSIWRAIQNDSNGPPGLGGISSVVSILSELSQTYTYSSRERFRILNSAEDLCKAPTIHTVPMNKTVVSEFDRVLEVIENQRAEYLDQLNKIFPWQDLPNQNLADYLENVLKYPRKVRLYNFFEDRGFEFFEETEVDYPFFPPDPFFDKKYFAWFNSTGPANLAVLYLDRYSTGGYRYLIWFPRLSSHPSTIDYEHYYKALNWIQEIAPAHKWQLDIGYLKPQLDELGSVIDANMRRLPNDWC